MNFIDFEILSGEKLKNFIKLQYVEPGGKRSEDRFTAIRGGIAFATDNSPFYCCVVGQPRPDEYADESLRKPNFELLYEKIFKGFDQEQRYSALGDAAAIFCCDFYCDYSAEKHQAAKDSFYDYRTKHPQTFGDLAPILFT